MALMKDLGVFFSCRNHRQKTILSMRGGKACKFASLETGKSPQFPPLVQQSSRR